MEGFWHNLLVQPLLDLLILLYGTVAFGNLGVAVIELTFLLRLALMPLNVLAERDSARYEQLEAEVAEIQAQYKGDDVLAKEQVRLLLKKRRVSPWAKTAILAVQLVVLIVLYKVFIHGINAQIDVLPDWIGQPRLPLDTTFFGFELGRRSLPWAFAVGVYLYLEIVHEQRKVGHLLGRRDAVYRYAFPLFTVVVLSLLPMVKSLFVLTSMTFSLTVSSLRRALWPTVSTK